MSFYRKHSVLTLLLLPMFAGLIGCSSTPHKPEFNHGDLQHEHDFATSEGYTDVVNDLPLQIDDGAIAADLALFAEADDRLQKLQAQLKPLAKIPAGSYHFHKAHSWLAFARAEYAKNDRVGTADQALYQAMRLIGSLEKGNQHIAMATKLIANSEAVREDLWRLANQSKRHSNFACVMPEVAELEVRLVRAGHEQLTLGWRRAYPQIQAAERLAQQIARGLENC